jgi:LacI family transcriptional regulator
MIHGVFKMRLSALGDIAVVVFDDISIASRHYIQLTTVFQPKYEMGKAAVKILLDESGVQAGSTNLGSPGHEGMRKGVAPGRRLAILEPRLIVRKTGIIT